jgi:hypothetical protein
MALLTINDLLSGRSEIQELRNRATMLSTLYENWLMKSDQGEHTREPGIHASEITGCERRITYSILGTERKSSTDNIWKKRFKMGHAVHALLQTDFGRMAVDSGFAISFQDEIPISPTRQAVAAKWNIYSHCDGVFILRDSWDGAPVLRIGLEIKTASPTEFDKLMQPKPEHIEQVTTYMACLDIPLMWVLYWNKGSQLMTGTDTPNFLVPFDPAVWSTLEARFERVHTAAALNTLPPQEEGVRCEFCAFSWTCKPAYLTKKTRKQNGQTYHTRWEQR